MTAVTAGNLRRHERTVAEGGDSPAWLRVLCLGGLLALGLCLPQAAAAQWREMIIDAQMAGDDKALVDINGDGFVDIVAGGKRVENEPLCWYRYPDWRKFVIALPDEEFTTEMDVGDMDGDGDMDLVVCDGPSGVNCRYYVNPRPDASPEQRWSRRDIGSGGGWVHDVRVGDYNGDGRNDVLTNRGLFTQKNDGGFAKGAPAGTAFGDVDGDGDVDIVADGAWFENPGWASHPAPGRGDEARIRVADVDGDGRNDILVNSGDGNGDLAWFSSASPKTGAWTEHVIAAGVAGGHTLDTGDVDGDGDLDLLSAEMFGEVAIFLNNGAGVFVRQRLSGKGAHNAVLGDVDRDGDLDAMGCNYTGHPPLYLWRNVTAPSPPPGPDSGSVAPRLFLLLR